MEPFLVSEKTKVGEELKVGHGTQLYALERKRKKRRGGGKQEKRKEYLSATDHVPGGITILELIREGRNNWKRDY